MFFKKSCISIAEIKDFYDKDNYITVSGCLFFDDMNMGNVTKAFSYSINVFHVSPSSLEGSTKKNSYWITGVE